MRMLEIDGMKIRISAIMTNMTVSQSNRPERPRRMVGIGSGPAPSGHVPCCSEV
ncbi:hypothetical protein D3C86_1853670 [compost metagenome]